VNEGPVLLHVWIVSPEEESDLVQRLAEMLDRLPAVVGFVSARLLVSADERSVAVVIETESVEARRRLEQSPGVSEVLHSVPGASLLKRLYHTVDERHA
jgi:hypothetical protein